MRIPISSHTLIPMVLVAALATPALAGKPGSSGGLLGACARFRDLATDHLTSDGNALYCDPGDGQVTIGGVQRGVGRFRLDTTKYTNTRVAGLDFSSPVTGSGISGTLTTEVVYQSGGLYEDSGSGLVAAEEGLALNFNSIPMGQTRHAALVVTFTPPGDETHRVAFGNETDPIVPCFGGNPVAVTCTATNGTTCRAWTMEGTQACVVRGFGKEKVDLGLWDMTFSVNIELQP